MKKINILSCLLVLAIVMLPGIVFGWGSQGGDGTNYGQLQEKAVFFNNRGSALTSAMAVVLDRTGTGVTAGTTLGCYVTVVNTADSAGVVGVTDNYGTGSYADQTPVVVVTKGVAQVFAADSTDGAASGGIVSTTNASGGTGWVGAGTADSPTVGLQLEAGNGMDGDAVWIWVSPTND